MRAGSAVLGLGRSVWLVAVGIALVLVVLIGSDARAAGPLSPIQTWTEQTPVDHPPTQLSNSMVFDPSTGQTVLFGGTSISASSNQTWIWDGINWTRKFPAHSPFPRVGASMAFDKKTGNVLLFGGTNTGAYYNDTWSWDGTDWTNLNPATDPSDRYGAGMAYDSASGEIVMYGGARDTQMSGGGTYLDDTWTWNGTDWTQETPANKPPAGFSERMEFDPGLGRILAYGIFKETTGFQQTWTWNGSNWSQLATATSPAASNGTLMDYDPAIGRMVLFGGSGYNNQTWTFDGTDWAQLSTPASPPVRSYGAMSFDPSAGRMLLIGGYSPSGTRSDTWYFGPPAGVESNWSQLTPVTRPPARNNAAMAFDPASGETVLFGGGTAGVSKLADTWTWNGTNWSPQTPANSPSARTGTASAFDPSTGEVVLFGGVDSSDTTLNQTWTWNGTNWSQETPANSPSPRNGAMMAYDEGSGEMVLYGGNFGSTSFDETWVWTGTNWVQRNPVHKPAGRYYGSMTFDQSTGETVLFGGVTATGFDSGNWIWTGSEWGQFHPDDQPDFRMLASMDFDPTVGEMLLFGGQTEVGPKNDTWTFAKQVGRPTAQIDDPAFGQEIPIGASHSTTFSCEEAPGGPGLASCKDGDGADAPTGQLDTSSAGEHFYEVTAISENGRSGVTSIPYEVEKAESEISMIAASSTTIGETIDADASLSGGYNPGGTITFRLYGPDDATCSGTPVFVNEARPVTDNGEYQAAFFRPTESGTYRWVVEYSGDENNDDAASACDATDSVSTLTKVQPTLTTASATDADAGTAVTVKATIGGGFNPGGDITFAAYGPDDATCSGAPAFESSAVPVNGDGTFDSPAFKATEVGTYRWVATYSGDGNNETASSICGADGSISTVTTPPDVCPASKPGLRLVGFSIRPPFGDSQKVMGVRVGFISANAVAKIKPSISYRLGGKKRTVRLKARTLKLDQRRNLRFRAPSKMKKDFRKAGVPLAKAKVTFAVKARIRPSVAAAECFRNIGTKKLKTRMTEVSGRVALRFVNQMKGRR